MEAAGFGLHSAKHAATLTKGEIEPHSISAGLDYPGGHKHLKNLLQPCLLYLLRKGKKGLKGLHISQVGFQICRRYGHQSNQNQAAKHESLWKLPKKKKRREVSYDVCETAMVEKKCGSY
ncbi:hypothetical protein NE237_000570 [Protea cynaroides]|uniref:Uncharacterized protein n=1 Tax=Protea cynaroides TaxID=273540 RepID=A0A9Q0QXL6_9MAGN|nr:hypothetical protein NE237_000570 [Protea cynaroides]